VAFDNFRTKLIGILSLILALQSVLAGHAQHNEQWPCMKTQSRIDLLNEAKVKGIKSMQNLSLICKETQKGNTTLFVLSGNKVRIGNADKQGLVPLTFNPPPKDVSFMSVSRPSALSGDMTLKTYLMAWGQGPYSFKNFGPNATLNAINCRTGIAIRTQAISLTSNGMIPELVPNKYLTFYTKSLSLRQPLMENKELCAVSLTLVNSCTPSGKGTHADWGPCYLNVSQQKTSND
tara:strand:- start:461 stop:1162 length:702 start_codon:yes stop_codon:yes gene_type:complete